MLTAATIESRAFFIVAAVSISTASMAQLAPGSFAQDFTVTDQFGTQHNLYTYLNEGKTVFLDVSATWCGPCWGYHLSGAFDELYINHGPAGMPGVSATTTNDVMVIWVDGDDATTTADMNGTTGASQGNWLAPQGTALDLPMANPNATVTNQINADYEIAYFPTVYRICPNRTVTEVGQLDAAGLYATIEECPAPASQANDPAMFGYSGTTATCGTVDVVVSIQNYGTAALTACTITVTGGASPIVYNWTGNLATYEVADVVVGSTTITAATNLNIAITSADDNTANNSLVQPVAFAAEGTTHVMIDILFDRYPEESSWSITDDAGVVVAAVDYGAGTLPADNSTKIEHVYLPSTGCYTFTAVDAYGDGFFDTQWGAPANGHMIVTTVSNAGSTFSTLWNYDGTYDFSEAAAPANVTTTVGIEELASNTAINVYPNPANDFLNVAYAIENNAVVAIDVVNMIGERVISQYVGSQASGNYSTRVDVSDLAAGIYMVNVTINGTTNVTRVTVK